MFPFVFLPVSYFRSYEFLSRGLRVIIWNTFWYHAILPSNVLLIDINYHIWKQLDSENKIFRIHCGIDKFCITIRKLIKAIELQYYMNLKANFNLNKFENLSIRFDRQSIIRIQSFFNVMEWKRPSNHLQSSGSFVYIKILLKVVRNGSCKFYI